MTVFAVFTANIKKRNSYCSESLSFNKATQAGSADVTSKKPKLSATQFAGNTSTTSFSILEKLFAYSPSIGHILPLSDIDTSGITVLSVYVPLVPKSSIPTKELSSSVDKIEKTFTSLSGTISSEGTKIDSTITTILGHYGVKPSDLGLTDSKVTGYAQGGLVKSVHKNGDDGLASLAVGEEVATVDVVNLANKIRQDKVLNALANGHTLNGMTMDGIGTTEINVNFGEAIGAINVPSGVSAEELQRIVNESYKYTSQKVTRDMAKIVGRKRPV